MDLDKSLNSKNTANWADIDLVRSKLAELFEELIGHSGFGTIQVDVKVLKKGYREVILSCGKQYRFVLKPKSEKEG